MHADAHRCGTVPRIRRHNHTISIRAHLRLSVVPFFVFILVPFLEIRRANNPLCHTETQVIDYQLLTKHRKALQHNDLRWFVTHCGTRACDTLWPVIVMLNAHPIVKLGWTLINADSRRVGSGFEY